jgi:hypothetical protein
MWNRKRATTLLLFVIVVIAVSWILRRNFSTSSFTKSSKSAESSQSRIGPLDIYPDSLRTPGAVNPNITQDNVRETVCNPEWSTKSIRPPTTYTSPLKVQQIREYGYTDTIPRDYEEDHLIPLELGGSPTDPRNLWPEPFESSIPDGGARFKDKVENYLHLQVCNGSLTLGEAQKEITEDWYRVYTTSLPH